MSTLTVEKPKFEIKQPKLLSERVRWLRDYYFQGITRKWNNEFIAYTTGTPWDFQYKRVFIKHRKTSHSWIKGKNLKHSCPEELEIRLKRGLNQTLFLIFYPASTFLPWLFSSIGSFFEIDSGQ